MKELTTKYTSFFEEGVLNEALNRSAYVGDATPLLKEDGAYEIYLSPASSREGYFKLTVFKGKSSKPYSNYIYPSMAKAGEAMDRIVADIKKSHAEKDKWKQDRKARAKVNFENIKVGDVFYSSWGYDQTNVDFYQVIEKKTSTVIVRKIGQKVVPGTEGFMSSQVMPDVDNFIGPPIVARVDSYGISGKDIYQGASIYDRGDKGVYSSSYA